MTSSHPTVYYKAPISKKISKQSSKAHTIVQHQLKPDKIFDNIITSQSNSYRMLKPKKSTTFTKKTDNIPIKCKNNQIKHKRYESSITEYQKSIKRCQKQLINHLKNNKKQKQVLIETIKQLVQKMMIQQFNNFQISSTNQKELLKEQQIYKSRLNKLSKGNHNQQFSNSLEKSWKNQIKISKLASLQSINNQNLQISSSQIGILNQNKDNGFLLPQQSQSITHLTLHKDFEILQHFKGFTITNHINQNQPSYDTKQIISNYIAMLSVNDINNNDFSIERDEKVQILSDLDCIPHQTQTINLQQSLQQVKNDIKMIDNAQIISNESSFDQKDHKRLLALSQKIKKKLHNQEKITQILNYVYQNLKNQQDFNKILIPIQDQQLKIEIPSNKQTISTEIVSPFCQLDNQNELNYVEFSQISEILNIRKTKLNKQYEKQLQFIQNKVNQDKITSEQCQKQRNRLQKWLALQTNEIQTAKKSLMKTYQAAEKIFKYHSKTTPKKYEENQFFTDNFYQLQKQKKMIRCLSQGYLNSPSAKAKNEQFLYEEQTITAIKEAIMNLREKNRIIQENFYNQSPQNSVTSYLQNIKTRNLDQFLNSQKVQNEEKRIQYDESMVSDVIQFIFLDLCTEIIKDKQLSKSNFKKDIQNLIASMDHQHSFKGIPMENRLLIKNFITQFHSFIVYNHQNALQNLNVPLGPSSLQILKYMQQNDQPIEQNAEIVCAVLSNQLFEEFEQIFISSIKLPEYYRQKDKQQSRVKFIKNSIFDAINEKLDLKRLYGILGAPFSWDNSSFHNNEYQSDKLLSIFKQACSQLYKQTSLLCGFMCDKQTISMQLASFSQKYLQTLRQDRLNLLITNFIEQNEGRWTYYNDDKAQIIIELSQLITITIFEQEANTINFLSQGK